MSGRLANTTKVFVGSLPAGTTVDELRKLFGPYGTIADCNVVNRYGFVHLEDKQLAFKAIDDLNDTQFKGSRIIVEKGRVKQQSSAMRRNRNDGPMQGNRDFRGAPYERRGPMPMPRCDNYGYGYDARPPLLPNMMMGSGPDRRPYADERNRYSNNGYRDAPDRPTLRERNNSMMDRRSLMDAQAPPLNGSGGSSYTYDVHRRPQVDMYNQRDIPSEPMGGYTSSPHDSPYGVTYPPLQQQQQQQRYQQRQRGFDRFDDNGLDPRRDMSLPRRY